MTEKLLILLLVSTAVIYFDLRFYRIPNWLTLGSWILYGLFLSIEKRAVPSKYIIASIIALISYILIFYISKKKLGMGDVKLSLFLGGINGVAGWYFTNLLASLSALLIFAVLYSMKKIDRKTKIPFGPFLCAGGILNQLIWGIS